MHCFYYCLRIPLLHLIVDLEDHTKEESKNKKSLDKSCEKGSKHSVPQLFLAGRINLQSFLLLLVILFPPFNGIQMQDHMHWRRGNVTNTNPNNWLILHNPSRERCRAEERYRTACGVYIKALGSELCKVPGYGGHHCTDSLPPTTTKMFA